MYEEPLVMEIRSGDGPDRICGDPSLFDICAAYCDPVPSYCVFYLAYNICAPGVSGFCFPEVYFN